MIQTGLILEDCLLDAVVIKIELLPQQYEQLTAIAQTQQRPVMEITQTAVVEWLERQEQLEHARTLMRQLGQGLDEGPAPIDAAANHDSYLYSWTSE
jgi:hypothetical protein